MLGQGVPGDRGGLLRKKVTLGGEQAEVTVPFRTCETLPGKFERALSPEEMLAMLNHTLPGCPALWKKARGVGGQVCRRRAHALFGARSRPRTMPDRALRGHRDRPRSSMS